MTTCIYPLRLLTMRTLTGKPVTKGIIGYGLRNHSYHKKQAFCYIESAGVSMGLNKMTVIMLQTHGNNVHPIGNVHFEANI